MLLGASGPYLRRNRRSASSSGRHSAGIDRPSYHRRMTGRTPDLTIPGLAVAELRVRVDVLNKVLVELVGHITPAGSEVAVLLRLAWEHGQAIAETIEGTAGS